MDWKSIDRHNARVLYNEARKDFRMRTNDYDPGTFEEFVRGHGADHVLAPDPNASEPPRPPKEAMQKMAADMERMRRAASRSCPDEHAVRLPLARAVAPSRHNRGPIVRGSE
ncbi:MAG: hypothetical protein JWM87_1529 [Candidatus Eremiobacteraeota bacterium]|nr:hypothetical protein [Candidatus Eremiobacteraeota bacterium]